MKKLSKKELKAINKAVYMLDNKIGSQFSCHALSAAYCNKIYTTQSDLSGKYQEFFNKSSESWFSNCSKKTQFTRIMLLTVFAELYGKV